MGENCIFSGIFDCWLLAIDFRRMATLVGNYLLHSISGGSVFAPKVAYTFKQSLDFVRRDSPQNCKSVYNGLNILFYSGTDCLGVASVKERPVKTKLGSYYTKLLGV